MQEDFVKKKKRKIKDLREIAIVIDSWDDVFSDFDPRPLDERTVSSDFVEELQKRYRESRSGDFGIVMYAPISMKNEESELMVARRLQEHFHNRFLQKKKALTRMRMRGVVFILIGISSLTFLSLATYYKFMTTLAIEIASIVLMPLGWFGFWEGLSKLIDPSPAFIQEEILFDKLSRTTYWFKYIEEEMDEEE